MVDHDPSAAVLFDAIVENIPDMIFVKDARTLSFVRFNRAGEALLGWSRDELIGKTDHDFYPKKQADFFQKKDREALAATTVIDIVGERIETKLGVRWLHTKKVAIREHGRPRWLLGISRDITDEVLRRAREERPAPARALPPSALGDAMRQALATADLAARDPEISVLLLGETGVGKGWLARRLHEKSPRHEAPFVEVNCASLSRELLESELFGHEKGSFTGADRLKLGLVEAAEGGTLFLDEVGDLPMSLQARLLTFLDEKTFRRVGGSTSLKSDVRIVAATNADLRAVVEADRFRRDLYFRLAVLPIQLPPLRKRREEVPSLAALFLSEIGSRRRIKAPTIDDDVAALLSGHDWPGNVRELRNALERAFLLAQGAALKPWHFALAPPEPIAIAPSGTPLDLATVERRHIESVLALCNGNRSRAARLLGITRATLRRKLG
jgi:PAS domain S-box-containing protein